MKKAPSLPSELLSPPWWRFSSYVFEEGYLRPAPGAAFRDSDPWKDFVDMRASRGYLGGSPYEQLVNIVREKKSVEETIPRLLEWTGRYGLLGVLPHHALNVRLAASAKEGGKITQQSYSWRRGEWIGKAHSDARLKDVSEYPCPAAVLLEMKSPFGHWDPLSEASTWKEEKLPETWGLFFQVPREERESFHYPRPLSEEFWRIYAEPIGAFLVAAQKLRRTVLEIEKAQKARPSGGRPRDILLYVLGQSVPSYGLSILLEGTHRMAGLGADLKYHGSWSARSLLGHLGAMIQEDLENDAYFRSCEKCGKFFVTPAYQSRFCSPKCRHVIQKREYRAKQKEKERKEG